jgi:glycosyltransferase involved in cell wall biosynthesis
VISPQGLYQKNRHMNDIAEARKALREELGLPGNSRIVLGAGYADHRKGIDLFAEVAAAAEKSAEETYFVWVGNVDARMQPEVERLAKGCGNLRLVPARDEISLFYAGADLYLMTSREDPFPSVVLEAMNVSVPVVGFRDAGGFQDIVTEETGRLVPYLDTAAMGKAVTDLLRDEALRQRLGRNGAELVREHFSFKDYVYELLELAGMPFRKVSAVIPNYNYARYIQGRLQSVLDQRYPVYETILLDDCSTDDSLEVADSFLQAFGAEDVTVVENETNSGSVFRQWARGIAMAKGEYVWIAEADDLAEPEFLAKVMEGFDDPSVVLSYAQSKQMAEDGAILDETYLGYTDDIDTKKWLNAYTRDGIEELSDTLAVKNTIPNVSAVVFKKIDISEILPDLLSYKVAGDWYFYAWLLRQGKIAFCPESLNLHRRHTTSVTSSLDAQRHYDEVVRMQELVREWTHVSGETEQKIAAYQNHVRNYLNLA